MKLLLVCAIVFAGFIASAAAQEKFRYSDEAERLWVRALEQYRAGGMLAAVDAFDRVIRIEPMHQRTTAASIMKARALYELGENIEVSRTLRSFLGSYQWSTYVPDAQYLLGLTYVRIRRMEDAADAFIAAWTALPPPDTSRLHRSITSDLTGLTRDVLSTQFLRTYLTRVTDTRVRTFLWITIAEKELAAGNITSAGIAVDSLDVHFPNHTYGRRVEGVRMRISERSNVKLGVLLPIMATSEPSAVKEIGNDVLHGVQFAMAEYDADPTRRVRVTLEIMDTERDAVMAARLAREMTDDPDIIGVIGPVFSHSTSAAVGPANLQRIPLVTPTANANGIAGAGEYIFQANPDFENRGRAMARFAVLHRGFRKLGVLAPSDPPGRLLAEAFIDEGLRLGARLVATEWYPRGTSDLSQQLTSIRRASMMEDVEPMLSFAGRLHQGDLAKLVQSGVPRRTLDSLVERSSVVPASFLLGPNARSILQSLQIDFAATEPRLDSLQYPATGIEALYLPISGPEEIGVVSSQLVYFNIKTQMLGSGEWNDADELNANRRYCSGVIFESDTHFDEGNPELLSFRSRFREKFRRSPTRNVLYGYDTAKLILELVGRGASNRLRLHTALMDTDAYQGLHAKIGFSKRRVNPWLWIHQFDQDGISTLREINVDEEPGK